jgi:hypothetical protein
MAAFPYIEQGIATKRSPLLGVDVTRAINGAGRAKSWYVNTKSNFDIALPVLSQAEVALLEAFIEANRATPIDLHYEGDGKTYVCIISSYDLTPLGACQFAVHVNMSEI